ncbi:MAG: TraV family lipoprotein [Alteromonadaceae bacterium]|nr:TraV family lipoprotein [Alteromonadaceae bacterium]
MSKLLILFGLCGLCGLLILSGCSALFPYDDEFVCKRPDNLGKCISSSEAYEEIINGDDTSPYLSPVSEVEEQQSSTKQKNSDIKAKTYAVNTNAVNSSRGGYERYLDANYKEIAELVERPITPLVNKAEVIEMLVLSYPTNNGKRLKGERYINVINNNPKFVLGKYLKKKPIAIESLFDK